MQTLRRAQEMMAAALLTGAEADDTVIANGLTAARRIGIYRNHFCVTLAEALALTFPVTTKLVGAEFFAHMAKAFALAHPPASPCVAEYGAEFPAFIAGFAPAASVVCLSDIAMMEWLLNEAVQADDYEGKMFYSRFPLGEIWETNQTSYTGEMIVDLDSGGGWVSVIKTDGEVRWQWRDLPEDAF